MVRRYEGMERWITFYEDFIMMLEHETMQHNPAGI